MIELENLGCKKVEPLPYKTNFYALRGPHPTKMREVCERYRGTFRDLHHMNTWLAVAGLEDMQSALSVAFSKDNLIFLWEKDGKHFASLTEAPHREDELFGPIDKKAFTSFLHPLVSYLFYLGQERLLYKALETELEGDKGFAKIFHEKLGELRRHTRTRIRLIEAKRYTDAEAKLHEEDAVRNELVAMMRKRLEVDEQSWPELMYHRLARTIEPHELPHALAGIDVSGLTEHTEEG